jgi:putative DNA primase/helicase
MTKVSDKPENVKTVDVVTSGTNGSGPTNESVLAALEYTAIVDYTQSEYADRWAYQNRDRFRYVRKLDRYLRWSSSKGVWVEVDDDVPFHFVEKMCRELLDEVPNNKENKVQRSQALQRCSASNVSAILRMARTKRPLAAKATDFDSDGKLINLPNATFDGRTGALRKHSPDDMITKLARGSYLTEPSLDDPVLQSFISDFEKAQPEQAVREELWAVIGGQLDDSPGRQALLLTGSGGNWKSTFVSCIVKALDGYADIANPKVLTAGGSKEHETILADLSGKRLAVVHLGEQMLSPAQLQMLVDEDSFKARGMRENSTTYTATHSFVVTMNPRRVPIRDVSLSVRRRILSYDWTWQIPDQRSEVRAQYLSSEAVLSYVITQLIDGYVRYHSEGFVADAGLLQTEKLLKRTDWYRYGKERLLFGTGDEFDTLSSDLQADIVAWNPELAGRRLDAFVRELGAAFNLTSHQRSGPGRPRAWSGCKIRNTNL